MILHTLSDCLNEVGGKKEHEKTRFQGYQWLTRFFIV
jgi:hypothetical protein